MSPFLQLPSLLAAKEKSNYFFYCWQIKFIIFKNDKLISIFIKYM